MTQADMNTTVQVSGTMVEGLYLQLRENGYSEEQILALGAGLARMARTEQFTHLQAQGIFSDDDRAEEENGLLMVGCPEGFSNSRP